MSASRRLSTSSNSSGSSSPRLHALDSSTALILVDEDEDEIYAHSPFDFSHGDDEDDDQMDSPSFDSGPRPYIQSMGPSSVLLYLLAPYLRLGTMLLPDHSDFPLKYSICILVFFAILSAFTRHLWYMLARYFRKADLEEIILDVLARGRNKERQRDIIRFFVRASTGLVRLLLATLFLHESVYLVLPLVPKDTFIANPTLITVLFAVIMTPFILGQSLASKRVIFATSLSIGTYVFWFGFVAFAYSKGALKGHTTDSRMGKLWQGITTAAFAFGSSSTLSLYASLKASMHPITTAKRPPIRSFKIISLISVVVALCLIIPLAVFAAIPNDPTTQDAPMVFLQPVITSLHAITLLLAIPSILVDSPSLPIPDRIQRSITVPLPKVLIIIILNLLCLLPSSIMYILSDIVLVCMLTSTYFVPALVHMGSHFLRRPLSIVIPSTPHPFSAGFETSAFDSPPNSANDPLLQRKEHALQRRQFHKRLGWDIGVLFILLPLSLGGIVWMGGRLAGQW